MGPKPVSTRPRGTSEQFVAQKRAQLAAMGVRGPGHVLRLARRNSFQEAILKRREG